MTGRGWITLSDEQKEIIKHAQAIHLDCDQSGNHGGSFIFLEGEKGSGKTVLGLEVGRMIKNKRNLMGAKYNKTCSLIFSAPDYYARSLLTTIGEKSMKIEQQFRTTSVETFYEEHNLGEYRYTSPIDAVTKIANKLSESGGWSVLVLDELWPSRSGDDWKKFAKITNIDIVYIHKTMTGYGVVTPPCGIHHHLQ